MRRFFLFSVALAFSIVFIANAQTPRTGTTKDATELVTRIYRVTDLVLETRDYTFSGIDLPGLGASGGIGFTGHGMGDEGGGMMGGMGGYGGGGMGGMGGAGSSGGMFAVADDIRLAQAGGAGGSFAGGAGGFADGGSGRARRRSTGLRLTMDDLIDVITATVHPDTWSDVGGPGNITSVAGMLVVSQTSRVHEQIAALLDALRQQGAAINSLTVRAHWVPSNDIDQLLIDHRRVDRSELTKQVKTRGAIGQISCFDSQTVHLVTGNIRSILTGIIPVVGQVEATSAPQYAQTRDSARRSESAVIPEHVLAQFGGERSEDPFAAGDDGVNPRRSSVGYTPITKTNVFGGLLQVTPSLDPDRRTAILDVHSIVIQPKTDQQAPVEFNNIAKLERINIVVQQFKTTLRVPINQPVLVAGSTLEPLQNDTAREQLYVIMEVLTDDVPKGKE